MVIVNGFLQEIELEGGGFDEQGRPVAIERTAGELIPCNISSLNHDKRGTTTDTRYDTFSATLQIDLQEFGAKRINIYDLTGRLLAEDREVQDIQVLEFVQAVQIKV